MKASLTVENYLKAILQTSTRSGTDWVTPGQVAAAMGVSPGTVTSMLKTLAESQLAVYRPYQGVQLTPAGRTLALRMLRRHRLIELFLVRTLGLSWDEIHEEAEHMEHAVSDALVDRIDAFLGHPECDPHGDPIPTSDGQMRGGSASALPLSQCPPGTPFTVTRVLQQQADFLRTLTEQGLELGTRGVVIDSSEDATLLKVQTDRGVVALGHSAALGILVSPESLD